MNWQAEIEAAAKRIAGHVRRTPVAELTLAGHTVAIKLEHMQHTGTFKARGAFNALIQGPVPAGGVVAASGGNHGAAVAHAAARLGIPARIFVPEIAGPSKIALIERTGATLTDVPGAYADALDAAGGSGRRNGTEWRSGAEAVLSSTPTECTTLSTTSESSRSSLGSSRSC